MTEIGNCYERAFRALTEGWHNDLLVDEHPMGELRLRLVHGYPRLTKDSENHPKGTKYGHAWLEQVVRTKDGHDYVMLVVDCGCYDNQERTIIPQVTTRFFSRVQCMVGSINENECSYYESQEAIEMVLERKQYGPWGNEPEDAVFG